MLKLSSSYSALQIYTPRTASQRPSFPILLKTLFLCCSSWGRSCSLYHEVCVLSSDLTWTYNMAFPPELSIMVVRQIAGGGGGIVGRGRGGRGWDTAAFDVTQLYRGDSWNSGRVIQRRLFILPCSVNIFHLLLGNDWDAQKQFR